ncbi:MAG TPA: radical SAM protein [Nannocystaceae bacterium]|nr:radical SAM protein [Nannocystaceae bacterium]
MSLADVRRRLPIVASLPEPKRRWNPQRRDTPAPKWAIWELTLACDQRCSHCGPRAGQKRSDELTTDEALQLVDELADLGVGEVVLIGGEAYLRNDVLLVVRRIRERGMGCTMTTGGYNLTQARADALVEAGVRSVTVSIDGLEESHDLVRGRPQSWQRAFEALAHVKNAGGKIACNTQINSRTRHELLELLELIAAAGVHSWQLQITVPHGNAADHPELILQPYMYLELFEVLEQVLVRARELGVRIWPGNNLGYFGPLELALRKSQNKHFRGCNAGVTTLGIESNGALKNCPSLGGSLNVGGSWRADGIRKVWEESYQLGYIRARTKDDLWGFCRDCYYAETCMAGCTAAAEPLLGRPGNNPFCHHRASTLAQQGLRERIEQVARASGGGFDNGLFRVIREHIDPELRAREPIVSVDEPRVSRAIEPHGPGRPISSAPAMRADAVAATG